MKTGVVYSSQGSIYRIKTSTGKVYFSKIKGKFRNIKTISTNPIAVGDKVDFTVNKEDETGIIQHIHPRKNYLIRKSVNLSKKIQIIASNIDIAFILVTIKDPKTTETFIDRMLVMANAYNINAKILFNKIDLSLDKEEQEKFDSLYTNYTNIGYQCLKISALKNQNINQLKEIMRDNTSLFIGHSGTGKTTLINTIDPTLNLKTQSISINHKQGQHTTTFASIYDIEKNTRIIDTPGIKGFGLVNINNDDIAKFFPDFTNFYSHCKFNNCTHINEPECSIKQMILEGKIKENRYQNYLKLLEEDKLYR